MELISSAKTTNLTSFETLKPKFVYYHAENDSRDFSFCGKQRLFIEANKTNGFEMLRVKATENESTILRLQRTKVESLYCVACPKQSTDEIAVGLSNGQVEMLNYRKKKYTAKFPAENSSSSAVFMDFNEADEYLSAVYENGSINLFGLKTKAKLETLNIDRSATLARFHSTKRFHLSIASYTGAVYVYDMQSKRRIFKTTDSHSAPCRDLCTSPATPDMLLTVGYDCVLNIFDMRRKLSPHQIRNNHPLSAVCVSECGRYCCMGNLKGELITYDLRNLKLILCSNTIHDSAVVRVAFVPLDDGRNASNLEGSSGNVLAETQNLPSEANQAADKQRRDSFFDFINGQACKNRDTLGPRDSFNFQTLDKRPYDFESRTSLSGRPSVDARLTMDLKSINETLPKNVEESITAIDGKSSKLRPSSADNISREKKSRSRIVIDDYIEEEVFEEPKTCSEPLGKKVNASLNENNDSSKENALNISRKEISYLMKLPDDKNSTPNPPKRGSSGVLDEGKFNVDMATVLDEIKNLRKEMNERFRSLEDETKFHIDRTKSDIYMQNFKLWRTQMSFAEDSRSLLLSLVQADPFVAEFIKLKEENAKLKEIINDLR